MSDAQHASGPGGTAGEPVTGPHFTPQQLAQALGKAFPPTPEQATVIEGPLGPKLVVAGAGAGKTETMASRVVYLVANGLVRPEQVLGLTFTRKAAQQLEQRIRRQLLTLRGSGLLIPGSPAAEAVENVAVNVSTYDSYAGDLVREYGLLVPVEPTARIITDADNYAIAHEVVTGWEGELIADTSVDTVVSTLIALSNSMDNRLTDPSSIAEHERDFRLTLAELEPTSKDKEYTAEQSTWLHKQKLRLQYLPLLVRFQERKQELGVVTFGEQMAAAATMAQRHPAVGAAQRARYRVIMLDEYQDTSHAQRVLLRSLYGGRHYDGLCVTAVGDPMQAIYGWRGATVENLAAFVEDFPQADGSPAPKDQLTTSWRNPSRVLDVANDTATRLFGEAARPVDPLTARPQADAGDIALGYFATRAEEIDFVADRLAARHAEALAAGRPLSAAVLVRANSHSAAIAEALQARGVPHEIVGLGGLLWEPEVHDLVALATLLIRPQDTAAALRILTGPIVGLGLDDVVALNARAANLAGARGGSGRVRWAEDSNPEEHLRVQLDGLTAERPDQVPGLGDAVADLGERERYTPEGLRRIEDLAAKLRHLRTYSLGKSLGDLFADIDALFNVRTEVLARGTSGGATHLDRFADVVAAYPGTTLAGLLDYLALARDQENALAPGEVPAAPGRVQIMTIHKSKGLEFEHVCVLHADSVTYGAKAATFLTTLEEVPGDDDVIDVGDAVKRSDFSKAAKAFIDDDRAHKAEESARLFYVALTRTETSLSITGSGTNNARGKAKKGPYEYLELLAARHPDLVAEWTVPDTPEDAGEGPEPLTAAFPALAPRAADVAAAARVRGAQAQLPALRDGELYAQWEHEASALIEEWEALQAPEVVVELPAELTASEMVALRTDALAFARRQRRPVPFKPNAYAKRGTAFHAWLEDRFAGGALLDDAELPGMGEDAAPAAPLELLKESFLGSPWADRTPFAVESPFEITIGRAVVRGRMDAVFQEPDGSFLVVDWKTGRRPQGRDMEAAVVQLAVYAEAWRRISGTTLPVRAAFHYVAEGYTFEPNDVPGAEELARILDV